MTEIIAYQDTLDAGLPISPITGSWVTRIETNPPQRTKAMRPSDSNDLVLGVAESAAVESRIASQALVCSSEALNDSPVAAQTEARTMPMVATSCGLLREVDRGGIEPPTPGFSVLCSTN